MFLATIVLAWFYDNHSHTVSELQQQYWIKICSVFSRYCVISRGIELSNPIKRVTIRQRLRGLNFNSSKLFYSLLASTFYGLSLF